MDWPTLVTSLTTAVSAVLVGGGLTNRRTRKQLRINASERDQLEDIVWAQRSLIRSHNAKHHFGREEDEVAIRDLPDWMTNANEEG